MDEKVEQKKTTELFSPEDREYYLFALKIIGDFGASIAAPVVVFALLGQYADERYGTTPYFTLAGFALAAGFSGLRIYRRAKTYGARYLALTSKKRK